MFIYIKRSRLVWFSNGRTKWPPFCSVHSRPFENRTMARLGRFIYKIISVLKCRHSARNEKLHLISGLLNEQFSALQLVTFDAKLGRIFLNDLYRVLQILQKVNRNKINHRNSKLNLNTVGIWL